MDEASAAPPNHQHDNSASPTNAVVDEKAVIQPNNQRPENSLFNNNFDPMSEHYYSKDNSFIPGPSGDFGCFLDYKSLQLKDENRVKLYVSNIPEELTDRGLRNIFQLYGDVIECCVRHADSGHKYGFVNYGHLDIAVSAMHSLHLKPPHRLVIKFSDSNIVQPTEEEIAQELKEPLIQRPTKVEYQYPEVVTNSTQNFLNSEFYKTAKDPENASNRAMLKLGATPKVHSKRYLAHKKRIASLTSEELTKPYIHNELWSYNLCHYCNLPAAYVCNEYHVFYCSLYCQEKKLEENLNILNKK